jgi:pSer/pThr/pTyr-binding forkhead associated (FHA) protein
MLGEVRLRLLSSPDGEEHQHTFTAPANCTIGRADECDVVVPHSILHADISRRHCELRIDPPHVYVRDLESLNGTFVNGVKIGQRFMGPDGRHPGRGRLVPLKDGDEVRLGREAAYRVEIHEYAEAVGWR